MSNQGVYKTNVTCEIGFSITDGTNWEKSRVAISSDVGPGYPEPPLIQAVLSQQMQDATRACEEQIGRIANRIVEQVRIGN